MEKKKISFKKSKRKIRELKSSKKIKEISLEKTESELERDIEEINLPRFEDILKTIKSSPVLERIAQPREIRELEMEVSSAPMPEKKEENKAIYSSSSDDSKYISETKSERTKNIEYPSIIDLSKTLARTTTLKTRQEINRRINEPAITRQEFLDPMRGNITNIERDNREKTFEVFDKGYIDDKTEEKKYNEFKQ